MSLQRPFDLHRFIDRPGVAPPPDQPDKQAVPSTQQLFAQLDYSVVKRKIVTLSGPAGSGKKRLLDQWARNEVRAVKPDQVVFISMSPSLSASLPPVCIAMSRIWDALEQIALPAYTRTRVRSQDIKSYKVPYLENLRIAVQKALTERAVRAITITRAQLCDSTTVDWLLDMRCYPEHNKGPGPHFALLLAVTSSAEGGDASFVRSLKKRDEVKPLMQLNLPYIQPSEFTKVLGPLVRLNLDATFHNELKTSEMAAEWHKRSAGNWYLLRELAQYLDEELGATTGAVPRVVTQEILNRVYARLDHAKE